jgi:hypothetical protein
VYSAVASLLVVLLLALPSLLDRRPPPERPDPPRSAPVVTGCSDEPPTDVRVDGRTVSVDYDVCVHLDEAGRFWAERRFTPDRPELVTRQILTLKECTDDDCPAIRASNGPLTSTRSGVAGRRYAACVWVDFVDGGQLPNRCSPKVPTPRPSVRQAG